MHVFDFDPVIKLKMLVDDWRTKNKKHWSEVPQAVSLTYSDFRYVWIQSQLIDHGLQSEQDIHVPSKKDIERNRARYKLCGMAVFIED